ncbi:very-long-chain 3-oxoacyl-CoA reductase [Halyomorpha halys]|uniref:very-long-chain 3-oxoacyl-CoA reductase n=1 Tax=Halyomorpha halys TaxID=286706 RepID=UPI0006D4EE11|nr:very-long-chain 3-oxoacyl-CoA reductase-like [Halyomorpha halys]
MMESLLESKLTTWLGIFTLFKLCLAIIPTVYRKIYYLLAPANWKKFDLRYYGEWAVVTGSTDGIGKAFAGELAKRGLNIILISRNEEKLRFTANEIEEEFGVKTLSIQADFTDRNCYDKIKKNLDGRDIGILVNNVGIARKTPAEYCTVDEEFIWNELDVNCGSVSMMTRIVLPQMKPKRKGIIVNISSLSIIFGSPTMGIYASTKCFVNMFSSSVQKEMERYNIKVKCLTPGFVETSMTKISKPFFERFPTIAKIFFPDSKSYVKSAVDSLNEDDLFATGYWSHTLMKQMFIWMPLKLRVHSTYLFIKILGHYSKKKNCQ